MTYYPKYIYALLLFIFVCLIAACKQEAPSLDVKKITNSTQEETKERTRNKGKKELYFEGPHNFYKYHNQIRTQKGDAVPRYSTNYKQIALQKAIKEKNRKRSSS